ncbi:hypothetical protein XFF6970_190002 [Xanthomonas citri pv. fuscans]|nr:hypothetical protein XFF6970_190002 [Xanthomonas citri pv. fuscans]
MMSVRHARLSPVMALMVVLDIVDAFFWLKLLYMSHGCYGSISGAMTALDEFRYDRMPQRRIREH